RRRRDREARIAGGPAIPPPPRPESPIGYPPRRRPPSAGSRSMRRPLLRLAAAGLLACAPEGLASTSGQNVPGPPLAPANVPSMAEVVERSAERSRRENDALRRLGVIHTGLGPYTVTQVDIPPTDPGDGFFTGTG